MGWILILWVGGCNNGNPSASGRVAQAVAQGSSSSGGGTVTIQQAQVDNTPQLQAQVDAYTGPLKNFVKACVFQTPATLQFTRVLQTFFAGPSGSCVTAANAMAGQPILDQQLNNQGLTEVSLLSEFTFLTKLNLSQNGIKDISVLSSLTDLTYLDISTNTISDISVTTHLTQLKEFDLISNLVQDLSPVAAMKNLQTLRANSNYISDISPLGKLTSLVTLELGKNTIANLSPLASLVNLQTLLLPQNNIMTVSALENLTNLQVLDLSQSVPASKTYLESSTETDVETNTITTPKKVFKISDISPLRGLRKLQSFNASYNHIVDMRVVSNFSNLIELYLGNNSMKYFPLLSPAPDCKCSIPHLVTIDVSYNYLDVSNLDACIPTGLSHLNLTYLPQNTF